jgi:hypothetical protein
VPRAYARRLGIRQAFEALLCPVAHIHTLFRLNGTEPEANPGAISPP